MTKYRIWDPFVRVFHWTVVVCFAANALFTNPEKDLHETLGYIVVGLVGARILWGLVGPRFARFSSFWPTRAGVVGQMGDMATGRTRVHLGHPPLGALMILNLLAAMLVIGATGYMMTTNAYFGIEWVEETHEVFVTWAEISVVAHVVAVIWESRRTGVNLPQAMITGVKSVPANATIAE